MPESLALLAEGLIDRGFAVVVDDVDDQAFGSRLIEFSNPTRTVGAAVRLVKDRGLWEAEIQLQGEWVGTYRVLLALNDAPYSRRAESHAERAATTLAVVDRVPQDKRKLKTITRRLADYRRDILRRLGSSHDG